VHAGSCRTAVARHAGRVTGLYVRLVI
jgi:hypothetical protein